MTKPFDKAFEGQPPARVLSHRVRLLYPFTVPKDLLPGVFATLREKSGFRSGELSKEFRTEMLDEASEFIFGATRDKPAPYYLRLAATCDAPEKNLRFAAILNGEHGVRWLLNPANQLANSTVNPRTQPPVSVFAIAEKHGIEVFSNAFGSAVLSITLEHHLPATPVWGDLLDWVYHLSHLKIRIPMLWNAPLGADPTTIRQVGELPEGPTAKAIIDHFKVTGEWIGAFPGPIAPRLLQPFQPFSLHGLIRELLAPVNDSIEGTQRQLMAYSVVEFGVAADFAIPSPFVPALSAMAQLEEGSHTPVVEGSKIVEILTLSNKHIVAASPMAFVHFVARQFGDLKESPYDQDRAQRILIKYFASTLPAIYLSLETARLHRQLIRRLAGNDAAELGPLSRQISLFTGCANLARINRRESHNHYFDAVRRASRAESSLLNLQRSVRDWSLSAEAQSQLEAFTQMRELQTQANRTQLELKEIMLTVHHSEARVGNLEIFIVLVYVLEMAHVFGEMTHAAHVYSLLASAIAVPTAMLLMLLLVKEWPQKLYNAIASNKDLRQSRWLTVSAFVLLLFFAVLLVPYFRDDWQMHAPLPPQCCAPTAVVPSASPL